MFQTPKEYKTPRRALKILFYNVKSIFKARFIPLRKWPKPSYCACCGVWSWSTLETANRTLNSYGFLCEECAEENDFEWSCAWAEYYGGCL